jgi:hypothetical protein
MKHIFSKIAKIGEEVRGSEVVKVELAKVNLPSALIFLKNGVEYSVKNNKNTSNAISEMSYALGVYKKQIDSNESLLRGNDDLLKRIQSTIQDAESAAKDLGVAPTAVPDYSEVVRLFNEMKQADKQLQDSHLKLKGMI